MNATANAVPKNESNVAVFTVPAMVPGTTTRNPVKEEHAYNPRGIRWRLITDAIATSQQGTF